MNPSHNRFLLGAVVALLLALLISAQRLTQVQTVPTLPSAVQCGSVTYTCAGERLFGLQAVTGVVSSAYAYEANLLDGSPPVADIDYLLPYAAQEIVTLPGGSADRYPYAGSIYVQGSGYVFKFHTPGGGHAALLHLGQVQGGVTATLPPHAASSIDTHKRGKTEDDTALTVGNVSTLPTTPTATLFSGGNYVGRSRWPDWAQYGNGNPGPSNSQLCLIYDQAAYNWFTRVLYGTDYHYVKPTPRPTPKPAAFPAKLWNSYRVAHHKRTIAYRSHGRLTYAAVQWQKHGSKRAGSITRAESWHPAGRRGVDGYELDMFRFQELYFWPRHPKWGVKWAGYPVHRAVHRKSARWHTARCVALPGVPCPRKSPPHRSS